jgi:hypothetical protein
MRVLTREASVLGSAVRYPGQMIKSARKAPRDLAEATGRPCAGLVLETE